ncbi:MAG: 50S ribosomal protein L15 [Candidatus Aenigmarchaeota archaeon ex4484_52]|nr:MAG: 50S ribosomal protein L15 [Candidatus Aenigmarchaeota archaeon ex4484_52]
MTAQNKRKKCEKQRGSRTCGWGSPKKHRGAGNRGGRGNAGSGKKGQQKMSSFNTLHIKNIGGKGFINKTKKNISAINIGVLLAKLQSLKDLKLIEKKDEKIFIDLNKIGYDKLLGSGLIPNLKEKIEIKTKYYSKNSKEKIEQNPNLEFYKL